MSSEAPIADRKRRHVVLVAYYFPPLGGSGVQRVAKWAKYLPENGWDVTVLTVEPGSYFAFDDTLLEEVRAAGVRIVRTRTLDPTRARAGKKKTVSQPSERRRKLFTWLTGFFFLPDNKRGWRRHARASFSQVMEHGPVDVVLSSAPPYTALMVGDELASHLDVPHIVDYRDDWVDNPRHRYPTTFHRKWHTTTERAVLKRSSLVLTINETIASLILQRNPGVSVRVVPQGFDPADFPEVSGETSSREIRLTYAGMFYDAQQPDSMLRAVGRLVAEDADLASRLDMRFVGLFPEEKRALIEALGLQNVVTLTGYRSHRDAVKELQQADILWMIVGHQKGAHMISTGKLHEYMGSARPILALAPDGEVRRALEGYGAAWAVDPDDHEEISAALASLIEKAKDGTLPAGDTDWIAQYDRKMGASRLAELLESVSG